MPGISPQLRPVVRLVHGHETEDGGGVRLTRLIGGQSLPMLDPFLLLDDFHSNDPDDYISGFPPHPHRGFETVTYMLAGRMAHADNAGCEGVIETGGVQWMTAGGGIIHSETPQQASGLMSGYQLWVNLPAAEKMRAPRYQEFPAAAIPLRERDGGARVRVIAGTTSDGVRGPVAELVVPALYLDVEVDAGGRFAEPIDPGWNAFIHLKEGSLGIGGETVPEGALAVLGRGEALEAVAVAGSRFILVAGRPLNEPVARRGPFVMNTEAELRQAFRDFHNGHF